MLAYCILAFLQWSLTGAHVNHTHEIKAERLKQKWGADNVIRDLEHLKEDLASVIELLDVGKLAENELAFYIVKMHDFDDNGGVDGIELRVAVEHSMDHVSDISEEERESKFEQLIDEVLEWDLNYDGYVDYGEVTQHFTNLKAGKK